MDKSSISIADWLLAEAVRHREESSGRLDNDEAANRVARSGAGSPSKRLAARARALPGAGEALADIASMRRLLRRCFAGLILTGALGGLLAARGLAAGREIDFLLTGLVLVGLPMLMLVLWVLALILSARGRRTPIISGRLAIVAGGRLATHLLSSPLRAELLRSASGLLGGPLGRWHLSMLSHAIWLAYGLGAWLGLVILFSLVQYELSWGTTLLAEAQVVSLITFLGTPIHALGLMPMPTPEWIAAGREGVELGSMRADWARFLLGMVLVYGALPRLLLLMLCAFLARRAANGLELELRAPGYLRLLPLIRPAASRVDTLGTAATEDPDHPFRPAGPANGRLVLLGIELERDTDDWPPALGGLTVDDMGLADRRAQFQALAAALAAVSPRPRALLAVCSLERTPDSGTAQRLNQLADAAGGALVLILADGDGLAARGISAETRVEDWQQLARRCGAQAVAMNPDQPDPAALARLAGLLEQPA